MAVLDAALPRDTAPPFDAWRVPARLHLVLFVHRVAGLKAGLYLLLRNPEDRALLQRGLLPDFEWTAESEPGFGLPLFRLACGDVRDLARAVSCWQEIAADSAFSLGMLARFEPVLRECGPAAYRELFWEAGLVGQALYLAAEAAGVRGTGIGCFLDDEVHRALGLNDHTWQSLYHFTVGDPVEDRRLRTASPYAHRAGSEAGPANRPGAAPSQQ